MIGSRCLCGLVVAFAVVNAVFYGGVAPYALLFSAVGAGALSVAHVFIVRAVCSAKFEADKREVAKGGVVCLEMTVKNRSPLFIPYVRVAVKRTPGFECQATSSSVSLRPFGTGVGRLSLTARYRGIHDPNIAEARVMDFLGLLSLKLPTSAASLVTVLPNVVELGGGFYDARRDFDVGVTARSTADDSVDLRDLRDYTDGDGLRKVCWKASARMNTLIVKEYEGEARPQINVLLDLAPPVDAEDVEMTYRAKDAAVESTIAIALLYLRAGWGVRLCWFDRDGELVSRVCFDVNALDDIVSCLALVEFIAGRDISRLIDAATLGMGVRQDVCVVTAARADFNEYGALFYEDAGERESDATNRDGFGAGVGEGVGMGAGMGGGAGVGLGVEVGEGGEDGENGEGGEGGEGGKTEEGLPPGGAGDADLARRDGLFARLSAIVESGGEATVVRVGTFRPSGDKIALNAIRVIDVAVMGQLATELAGFAAGRGRVANGRRVA